MHLSPNQVSVRRKKNSQLTVLRKSPYFASVSRKSKHQTNSPTLHKNKTHYQSNSHHLQNNNKKLNHELNSLIVNNIQNQGNKHEKKVFQRFKQYEPVENTFQQSKQVKMEKYTHQELQIDTRKKPRDILTNNKKYQTIENFKNYKSIPMLSPKQKQKCRKFRMKTRSGKSLGIAHHDGYQLKSDDWLCKQLIINQVYGHDDSYDFQ